MSETITSPVWGQRMEGFDGFLGWEIKTRRAGWLAKQNGRRAANIIVSDLEQSWPRIRDKGS